MNSIKKVERAAAKAASARQVLERAILDAMDEGISLRKIAQAAGMSHETVRQLNPLWDTPRRTHAKPGAKDGGHIHPPGHFCGSNCPMNRAYRERA